MKTLQHIVRIGLLSMVLAAASGCSDPKEGKDCKQARWYEARTVDKSAPGIGRHSLGSHAEGCFRSEIHGMNTRMVPLDPVCCDR